MDKRFELLSIVEALTGIAKDYKGELDTIEAKYNNLIENYKELHGQFKDEQNMYKDGKLRLKDQELADIKREYNVQSLGLEAACDNIQKLRDESFEKDAKINQLTNLYQLERQELAKEKLKQKIITKIVYKDIQPELRYDSNGYTTYYRGHNGWFLIGDVCKSLAIPDYGRNRVFAMLKGLGVLDKDGFCYQKYIDLGYLKLAERYFENTMVGFITVINERGITWLKQLIKQDIVNKNKDNSADTYVIEAERVEMVEKEIESAIEVKE